MEHGFWLLCKKSWTQNLKRWFGRDAHILSNELILIQNKLLKKYLKLFRSYSIFQCLHPLLSPEAKTKPQINVNCLALFGIRTRDLPVFSQQCYQLIRLGVCNTCRYVSSTFGKKMFERKRFSVSDAISIPCLKIFVEINTPTAEDFPASCQQLVQFVR